MIRKTFMLTIGLMLTWCLFACQESSDFSYPENPQYSSLVTCHDPSVIEDQGTYYTFGSHFAVTSSTDLVHFKQVSTESKGLYGDIPWTTVLADAVNYVNNPSATSTWAPAVKKLDGKYYMYYSLSTFGSAKSYIGRVESDNITGPYSKSVEVIKTDGTGGPNAIDPEIFYDREGKLWMVYGSFFDGIYIKELYTSGSNIGLPKESGFGKKIWQGSGTGPEGPYIFYNKDTDYYYLMTSHGSLSTNYNMRVARSKTPDGDYEDHRGNKVENNSSGGLKLVGNYHFSGYKNGYAALGHNSVIEKNGEYFVIYHSRYKQGGAVTGYHNQFCNQLFFNKDGWPVMAPNNYAFEKLGKIIMEDAAGSYDLIIHTGLNSEAFASSIEYRLDENGTVYDKNEEESGSYKITGDYYISITIGLNTFEGVIAPQWNKDLEVPCLSITAVSSKGLSLWANSK